MLNLNFPRISAIAIAIAALSTGSAMAAENLYGGGATFPALPYVGTDYLNTNPNARLSTNAGNNAGAGFTTATLGTNPIGPVVVPQPTANSVFLAYSNTSTNKVSYCQTGSGFGKNTLTGSTTANQACRDFSVSPLGLSAAAAAPDFIGTDAPYTVADYNAFLSGGNAASRVGIVQVPTLAGAIALPQSTPTASFNLSAAQVCQIYSGLVSDWGNVSGSGTTGPIKIVYRTDSSGTSFAFTTYLKATCNGTSNVPSGFVFSPNQTFTSALPGGVSGVYGSRAIGASGNNGVVTAVRVTNANALGYADIGEVLSQNATYVKVAGFDPKDFGSNSTPVTLVASDLLTGRVLDSTTTSGTNTVPGSAAAAVKNCVRLVNPNTVVTNAYPIVAITYLAGFTSGNGSAAHIQAVKGLFNIFYNSSTRPALPQGFAYLAGVTTSAQNTVNTCVQ